MSALFRPIWLGGLGLTNRIVVSPMCQYSAVEGVAQPWHWQHLGSLAISGAGVVILEATAVEADGRISPADLGLWNDEQAAMLARLRADIAGFTPTPMGVQLAHAGRKASVAPPWIERGKPLLTPGEGGWQVVAPSAVPFDDGHPLPATLGLKDLARIRESFVAAARRADAAGFELVELHGAHGYLLHEFMSPWSNIRTDAYGGTLENRMRFPLEVAQAVRAVWPANKALGMRITGSDWLNGGVTPDEAVALAGALEAAGLDYVCVSSGGTAPKAPIPGRELGYQVPFAEKVKAGTGIKVMSVGMIVRPDQAEEIVASGKADMVALARAMLDDPRWPMHAAQALGAEPSPAYPKQYERVAAALWPGYAAAHGQGT
jgi:2,4-dienoyl-CoA reductase-like NADH-dependent reductase (Old Yellow Enzyme family)